MACGLRALHWLPSPEQLSTPARSVCGGLASSADNAGLTSACSAGLDAPGPGPVRSSTSDGQPPGQHSFGCGCRLTGSPEGSPDAKRLASPEPHQGVHSALHETARSERERSPCSLRRTASPLPSTGGLRGADRALDAAPMPSRPCSPGPVCPSAGATPDTCRLHITCWQGHPACCRTPETCCALPTGAGPPVPSKQVQPRISTSDLHTPVRCRPRRTISCRPRPQPQPQPQHLLAVRQWLTRARAPPPPALSGRPNLTPQLLVR